MELNSVLKRRNTNNHGFKKYLRSLDIREMKIKTSLRFYLTWVKLAKINQQNQNQW